MKIIITITALLALSSILVAAGEDWTLKYQRLGHRGVPKGSDASALTAERSVSQTTSASAAEISKASSFSAALMAPSTRQATNSYSAEMSKAGGASAAFAAPSTRGAEDSFSNSAAPARSSDKAKRATSGNRPNSSRASELNPPK